MRTFIILWLGQLVSSIGSSMTYFALTLWVWQRTESATAVALILVFYQLPQMAIAPFSGIWVDRLPRKRLLLLSDSGAACCTISVGILAAFQILQLWHIYLIAVIIGCFGNIQAIIYSTLIPMLVPKPHHTRANSMGAIVVYGAGILSPALAGILYPLVGFLGITVIDMGTFAIAILALLAVQIPTIYQNIEDQPPEPVEQKGSWAIWHDVTFGFRYIASQPSLLSMVVALSAFSFLNQICETLYQPMVLARTEDDTQILGGVVAAAGVGGVVGAIGLSIWGGFQRRIFGMLIGFIGTGLSNLFLSLGQLPAIWGVARFGASFHQPLIMSSYMAVWYAKVAPERQGRVFAADHLISVVIESSAGLSAGLLADQIFEPAMQVDGWLVPYLGSLVGIGSGSGMALLSGINAIGMMIIGVGGLSFRPLRSAETLLPDADELPNP